MLTKIAAIQGKPKAAASQAPVPAPVAPKAAVPEPKPALSGHGTGSGGEDEQRKPPPTNLPTTAPLYQRTPHPLPQMPVESAAVSASITAKALLLLTKEAGLEISDLENDASFAEFNVDSLILLDVAEKFRTELDVKVDGSLFPDSPTIGDLPKWLEKYYSQTEGKGQGDREQRHVISLSHKVGRRGLALWCAVNTSKYPDF